MTASRGAVLRRCPLGPPVPNTADEGFTLIELMVVIVVISVLLAIAIPSFLSARERTQNHAAQANLHTALEAANSAFTDATNIDFSQLSASSLAAAETSLRFSTTPATTRGTVAVVGGSCDLSSGTVGCVALAEPAGNGTCWYAVESDTGALYGKSGDTAGACDAANAQNVTLTSDFPA
jgi:type IV pilus assembly protein PilA